MEKLLINTPQNVRIEFPLASVGTRILAFGLDYALIVGYIYVFLKLIWPPINRNIDDTWLLYGLVSFIFLPVFFYSLFTEIIFNGQTIGKKVTKIKVVKIDGTRAGIYEYFMRWTMTIVDVWMLSGLIGLVAAIVTKKTQRIGDIAASTTVIALKPKMNISETVLEEINEDHEPVFPQVINLTDKDINLIKKNFKVALTKKNDKLLDALVDKVKSVLEITEIKMSRKEFIETVLKDHYNYFKDR